MKYKIILNFYRKTIVAILLGLLVGCNSNRLPTVINGTTIFTVTPTETYSNYYPSNTSPVKTKSPSSNIDNTPRVVTITPSVISMRTNTPMPHSPTLIPTIITDQRNQYVLNLLQNNAGCQLPCWWGFYPGETQWADVNNIYHSIGLTPEVNKNTDLFKLHFDEQNINIATVYVLNNSIIDAIFTGGNQSKDNRIALGEPDYLEVFENYLLPKILSDFGIPEDVWVRTFPGAPEGGPIPFYVLLDYFSIGISVKYSGFIQNTGDGYSMCPQRTNIDLFLWSPEKSNPINVAYLHDNAFIRKDDFSRYLPIDQGTGISKEDFYQTFKNPQNQVCLITEPDLWLP